ncbi:hypothetical protein HD593_001828 [Nonomuraea rubra]|uniref:Uncharacterized protein n=1 Tax=Nonomuraea rubra TaxID=46180 RepID=A0A7X0TX49_9ACTN|nr:hypothetical protein [Nonomuraea rubra]MBB6547033.1 hypothetical protein [Nonomuraea rubra]
MPWVAPAGPRQAKSYSQVRPPARTWASAVQVVGMRTRTSDRSLAAASSAYATRWA